jgi:hypothetical protein
MRANVYSLEPLAPAAREAVHDSLDMVAAYMGEAVVARELQVKLPLTAAGLVNPKQVGYSNFDMMVELHLLAVPLEGSAERPGIADVGRGVGFTNITGNSKPLIRTVTAHEVAHAVGFVLPDSAQADPDSQYHCLAASCLMNRRVVTDTETLITTPKAPLLERLRGKKAAPLTESTVRLVNRQYDFCGDCKADLHHYGQRELNRLRYHRLTVSKKV